jgi:drug/metabolite transporter (DMT)-like permease
MFRAVYLVLLACVLVIVAGQVLFKIAALGLRVDGALPLSVNMQNNLKPALVVMLALVLYFASTCAWVLALRSVPLSVAFMFNVISFALVPAAGFLVFGESVPRFFWLGSLCIAVGLALILLPGTTVD